MRKAKRRRSGHGWIAGILSVLLLAAVGAGLVWMLRANGQLDVMAVHVGLKENPYYQLGDTWWEHGDIEEYYFNQLPSSLNEIYRELYERLRGNEDEAELYASVGAEDFWTAYYAVLADHPEFFWVGTDVEISQAAINGRVISYRLTTTVPPQERDAMRSALEAAADACISGISDYADDYQKIKYVYEYLIDLVDYVEDSRDNQNVQSALLYHESVCAGYARAFQYILHRMGLFCTYVTGRIEQGGDHGWNIVRIADQYYNVDVTWGDPVFLGGNGVGPGRAKNYNYLCCTDADLLQTHTPSGDVPLPACTDDSYNYYRLNGLYHAGFDYDEIYNTLMQSVWADEDYCVMKFGGRDAYNTACYEIFENGMIRDAAQYLMDVYGASTWNYSYHTDDSFCLITIYWK